MSNVWTIARKEFAAYFNSPIAYIVIVLFLVVTSVLFFFPQGFFVIGQASLRAFFSLLPWTLVFFIPPITMRLFAEEKKLGTIEVLMTLPVRDHEAVLGKFLGAYGFVLAMLAFTLSLPLTVAWLGDPDPGPILGGYVGALLLAASYVAIGLFVSSLTENQIIAFIVSAVALVALVLIGDQGMLAWLPASAVSVHPVSVALDPFREPRARRDRHPRRGLLPLDHRLLPDPHRVVGREREMEVSRDV